MKGIVLFPGAFKPPTKGHFDAVKSLATNTYKIAAYDKTDSGNIDKDSLRAEEPDKEVTGVKVFIGSQSRDGITAEISEKIWSIYSKHLPSNVEVINTNSDPVRYAINYAKKRPKDNFFPVVGIRDESDFKDLGRLGAYKNLENTYSLRYFAPEEIRATNLRKAIKVNNMIEVEKHLPSELSDLEIEQVSNLLKDSIVQEQKDPLFEEVNNVLDSLFQSEGSSGTAIAARSSLPSKERSQLVHLYKHLKNVIYSPKYNIDFQQDRIVITLKDEARISYDYTPYMGSILEYMIDEGIKITPLPEVKIVKNESYATNVFGKTAYYSPELKEISLFTSGRHPKDVLRSFTHEMIHHTQNLEGRLGKITTSNTNEDDNLVKLEEEAYLKGNMVFRNWEDYIKNKVNED